MSIAPPPAYPTWPPQPYPPAPQKPRRLWPAAAAVAAGCAIVGGLVTTLVTIAVTTPEATNTATTPVPSTVTVTAGPPPAPAPLPVAQADAQTCRAWESAQTLAKAGTTAMAGFPEGVNFTDPVVQENPAWKAAVVRASDLFGQAAITFEAQIAPGTRPILAQVSDTTVGSLQMLSESYRTFDPASGNAASIFLAAQQALGVLCQ